MKRPTNVWKEGELFVAKDLLTGVLAHGKTAEEANKNLVAAVALHLKEISELGDSIGKKLAGGK